MAKQYKISIILPSLNVRKYIRQCLDSVINQTIDSYEIICVDAGSTDGTLEIIHDYAESHENIKVIISEKKSYGYQMNIGINEAVGDYIGIVETDDYVPLNMYQELYTIAKKNHADIVKADFIRFTDQDGEIRENLTVLTHDPEMYNHIIDVSKTRKCFRLAMNTWSGIYRRQFLIDNNIRHNETPGASFQDNGFWFQTFIYAKRAYFIDKPYYRNRRDNSQSSVFDRKSAFKIFEEYRFIWEVLTSNREIYEKYKYEYTEKACLTYLDFLEKAQTDAKYDFICEISKQLEFLIANNAFSLWLFSPKDRGTLLYIKNSPEKYYNDVVASKEKLEIEARKYDTVIIYGAGMVGHRVLNHFRYRSNPINVLCFAVSKKEKAIRDIKDSVPIKDIHELLDYKENALIIVAVTNLFRDEMLKTATDLGFRNIICLPDEERNFFDERIKKGEDKRVVMEAWYKYIMGEEFDYNHPRNFCQWQLKLILDDEDALCEKLRNRLELKGWFKEQIGSENIVPTLAECSDFDDIDFCAYGPRFYVTDNSAYTRREFVNTEDRYFNRDILERKIKSWRNTTDDLCRTDFLGSTDYTLLIEPTLYPDQNDTIFTYWVVCFNGNPEMIMVGIGTKNDGAYRNFYDLNFNLLPFSIFRNRYYAEVEKPACLDRMVDLSRSLSKNFRFIMIRFIINCEKLYVDGIDRTIDRGLSRVIPREWDEMICKKYLVDANNCGK